MGSKPRASAVRARIRARRRSLPSCMRWGPTVRSLRANSTPRWRARARSRPPTARSPAASKSPSTPSSPCWRPMTVEQPRRQPERAMSQVTVTINGRQFRLACEDGQEGHLTRLAGELDKRIEELRTRFGEIGDTRLTIMAALMVADEVAENSLKLPKLEDELAALQEARVASAEPA